MLDFYLVSGHFRFFFNLLLLVVWLGCMNCLLDFFRFGDLRRMLNMLVLVILANLLMMNFFMLLLYLARTLFWDFFNGSVMLWFDMLSLNVGIRISFIILIILISNLFILDRYSVSLGLNMLYFLRFFLRFFYLLWIVIMSVCGLCLYLISLLSLSWILLFGLICSWLFYFITLFCCFN
jgi:hypothetical protein